MKREVEKKAPTRGKGGKSKSETSEAKSRDKDMEYKIEKIKAPGRDAVEVLGETFEEGTPEGTEVGKWRQKLESRQEKLKYLETGERYYYSQDWYGSEKRKTPA
ncbi:hypothetical protein ACFLVJ_00450 [Chloroflexota bacterium]